MCITNYIPYILSPMYNIKFKKDIEIILIDSNVCKYFKAVQNCSLQFVILKLTPNLSTTEIKLCWKVKKWKTLKKKVKLNF